MNPLLVIAALSGLIALSTALGLLWRGAQRGHERAAQRGARHGGIVRGALARGNAAAKRPHFLYRSNILDKFMKGA